MLGVTFAYSVGATTLTNLFDRLTLPSEVDRFVDHHDYLHHIPNLKYKVIVINLISIIHPSLKSLTNQVVLALKVSQNYSLARFDWLKKNRKDITDLISYSDPQQGHVGTIYQATNFSLTFT